MIEILQDTQDMYCISGEGSLLLLLPNSLSNQWNGSFVQTDRQIEADFRWAGPGTPATDYDRACDVKGYFEKIAIGDGEGIVIADDYPVCWIPSPEGGMFLRITDRWQDLQSILQLVEETMWSETYFEYDVKENHFMLFDPAYRGDHIKEKVEVTLRLGKYKATTIERTIEAVHFLAHRLILQPTE